MKDSIAIFGAGIAGLAAAHELAERGYQIDIYEPLSVAGGLARSERFMVPGLPEACGSVPGEVSWRGYGPFYHNAFNLMRRIPTEDGGTVYDRLTRPVDFLFTSDANNVEPTSLMEALSFGDRMRIYWEVARNATASERRIAYDATVNAADYMSSRLSPRGYAQFTKMFGPWVGIDPQRASLHHVMSFLKKLAYPGAPAPYLHQDIEGIWLAEGSSSWSVFDRPTSEAWFYPWVTYLKSLGVRFHWQSSLKRLTTDQMGTLNALVVDMVVSGTTKVPRVHPITADNYILAMGPYQAREILKASNGFESEALEFEGLTADGEHLQVSFRLGFSKAVQWPGVRTALIISSSPYNITLYRQDDLWDKSVPLGGCLSSLWSGTACISYIPGVLFGKSVAEVTKEQFKAEILEQLRRDTGFNSLLEQGTGSDFSSIVEDSLILFEVWYTFEFGGVDGSTLHNRIEPKFVDSTTTRAHQPSEVTHMSQVWFAGGHTLNSVELYSMEGAAESGRRVADRISGNQTTLIQQELFGIPVLQTMDVGLSMLGAPSVVDVLIFKFICLIVIVLVVLLKWLFAKQS
jgi:uncharacterized protein with NAD-binding domain and iron-sulfur cluster